MIVKTTDRFYSYLNLVEFPAFNLAESARPEMPLQTLMSAYTLKV